MGRVSRGSTFEATSARTPPARRSWSRCFRRRRPRAASTSSRLVAPTRRRSAGQPSRRAPGVRRRRTTPWSSRMSIDRRSGARSRTSPSIDRFDPFAAVCALVAEDPGAMVVEHGMHEDDVVAIMADPLIGVGSDNGSPVGVQHPRTWGCFPEFFGRYVRDLGVVGWEEGTARRPRPPRSNSTWRIAARCSPARSPTSASRSGGHRASGQLCGTRRARRWGSNTWCSAGRSWSTKACSPVPAPAWSSEPGRAREGWP